MSFRILCDMGMFFKNIECIKVFNFCDWVFFLFVGRYVRESVFVMISFLFGRYLKLKVYFCNLSNNFCNLGGVCDRGFFKMDLSGLWLFFIIIFILYVYWLKCLSLNVIVSNFFFI